MGARGWYVIDGMAATEVRSLVAGPFGSRLDAEYDASQRNNWGDLEARFLDVGRVNATVGKEVSEMAAAEVKVAACVEQGDLLEAMEAANAWAQLLRDRARKSGSGRETAAADRIDKAVARLRKQAAEVG